ncbi:hypothetical protein ALC60_09572 [Trachymyrmex zeteki]|uniref:Uncharacterized protein n=2 Tax=Mycetomoellerius zeteki TaxID=64791 RepID=A0A151WU59_9HYME|nr:hypothetical protein ALC60_09572 [Trachymyrmex zeteki]
MIYGGIIPEQLFHEGFITDFASIPKIRELSRNFATSAASTASNTFNDFRTRIDNLRTVLSQRINIPPEYPILHRIMHGDIWPNVAGPAPIVSGRIISPRPIGNYRGIGDSIGAASAGAASSAASRRLAKY